MENIQSHMIRKINSSLFIYTDVKHDKQGILIKPFLRNIAEVTIQIVKNICALWLISVQYNCLR